jgi:hypothetical protein
MASITLFCGHITHIFLVATQEKVRWVYTGRIIAAMADAKVSIFSILNNPRNTVRLE